MISNEDKISSQLELLKPILSAFSSKLEASTLQRKISSSRVSSSKNSICESPQISSQMIQNEETEESKEEGQNGEIEPSYSTFLGRCQKIAKNYEEKLRSKTMIDPRMSFSQFSEKSELSN